MSRTYSAALKEMVETYYALPLKDALEQSIQRHCDATVRLDLLMAIAKDFEPAVGRRMDYVTMRRWCVSEGINITRVQTLARRVRMLEEERAKSEENKV